MQQHLQGGCKRCAATLRVWQEVSVLASRESAFAPPPGIVNVVKTQFALAKPQPAQKFRLVFDSLLQPATAGVRGLAAARQLLYETDEFCIDLRFQLHREAKITSVTGQVLSRVRGSNPTNAIPVRLCSRNNAIVETLTNQFGEFHLEFNNGHDLHLAIGWDQNSAIVLPLTGVSPQNSGGLRQC